MSALLANLWGRLHSAKQAPQTIMLVGLDNSGKTSILARLKTLAAGLGQQARQPATSTPPPPPSSSSNSNEAPFSETNNPDSSQLEPEHARGNQAAGVSPTIGFEFERLQVRGQTLNVLDFSGHTKYRPLWQEFYNCVDAIVFVLDSSDLIRLVVARDELETLLQHPFFGSLEQPQQQPQQQQSGGAASACQPGQMLAFQMVQKQLTVSQGRLIQAPLEGGPSARQGAAKSTTQQQEAGGSGPQQARQGEQRAGRRSSAGGGGGSLGRRTRIPLLFLANKTDLTNSADGELIARTLNLHQLPPNRHPWHLQATSAETSQGLREGFEWLLAELHS